MQVNTDACYIHTCMLHSCMHSFMRGMHLNAQVMQCCVYSLNTIIVLFWLIILRDQVATIWSCPLYTKLMIAHFTWCYQGYGGPEAVQRGVRGRIPEGHRRGHRLALDAGENQTRGTDILLRGRLQGPWGQTGGSVGSVAAKRLKDEMVGSKKYKMNDANY